MPSGGADRRPAIAAWIATAVCVAALLWPLGSSGFLLVRDMVFTPHPPIGLADLGVTTQLPRAVPSNLVAGLLSAVFGGQIAQRLVLGIILSAAGIGAARLASRLLAPRVPWQAAAAAGAAFVWNPWVVERLLLGQWTVLIGWAALPWVLLAADDLGSERAMSRGLLPLTTAMVLASFGGGSAWILAAPAALLGLVAGHPRVDRLLASRLLAMAAVLAATAVPWLVPSLLRPGGVPNASHGAEAFALRSDTVFGPVVSALSGGGVWNADAVPSGRASVTGSLAALVVVLAAGVGWLWPGRDRAGRGLRRAVGTVAVLGLAVALLSLTGWGRAVTGWLPGGGLLRDASRFLAPWTLALAVGTAAVAARLADRGWQAASLLVVVLPFVALPGAALRWGGDVRAVHVPPDYAAVARIVEQDPAGGALLVLPPDGYRAWAWNPGTPVRQPLDRIVKRPVVLSDDLTVRLHGRDVTVRGEDRWSAEVLAQVSQARDGTSLARSLAAEGVRFVVADGPHPQDLRALARVYEGANLTLYRVEGAVAPLAEVRGRHLPDAGLVVISDCSALIVLAGLVVVALRRRNPVLACDRDRPADEPEGV